MKRVFFAILAALALSGAAAAADPIDWPTGALCGQQGPVADVACVDFSAAIAAGAPAQLPRRQMQVFVKPQPRAIAYMIRWQRCSLDGTPGERGSSLTFAAPELSPSAVYAAVFQIDVPFEQTICAVEVIGLKPARQQ